MLLLPSFLFLKLSDNMIIWCCGQSIGMNEIAVRGLNASGYIFMYHINWKIAVYDFSERGFCARYPGFYRLVSLYFGKTIRILAEYFTNIAVVCSSSLI